MPQRALHSNQLCKKADFHDGRLTTSPCGFSLSLLAESLPPVNSGAMSGWRGQADCGRWCAAYQRVEPGIWEGAGEGIGAGHSARWQGVGRAGLARLENTGQMQTVQTV